MIPPVAIWIDRLLTAVGAVLGVRRVGEIRAVGGGEERNRVAVRRGQRELRPATDRWLRYVVCGTKSVSALWVDHMRKKTLTLSAWPAGPASAQPHARDREVVVADRSRSGRGCEVVTA